MSEITNSKRTLFQATYSPIDVRDPPVATRAWEKWTYFASLAAQIGDFGDFKKRIQNRLAIAGDDQLRQQLNQAMTDLNTLEALIPHVRTPDALSSVRALKDISPESLVVLGEVHLVAEEQHAEELLQAHQAIAEAFAASDRGSSGIPQATLLEGYELLAETPSKAPDLAVYRRVQTLVSPMPAEPHTEPEEGGELSSPHAREMRHQVATVVSIETVNKATTDSLGAPIVAPSTIPLLAESASWALSKGIRVSEAQELLDLSARFETSDQPLALKDVMSAKLNGIKQLLDGFKGRMKVEPIGLLHLERISYTPVGIERGELVHSVPLSPGEEVNITHREWSNTSEEFEKLVADYMESFSEQGVVEKSELSESSLHQTQHSIGYNTSVTVTGGYGPVNITSSSNYNVQNSASSSAQVSQKRSQEITKKASSRAKREHKMSFRVASAAGTEDQRVQHIKNADPKNTTRVDYYQLMRKWRVDLERCGLRLTYDIIIPEPGSDIISRLLEVQELGKKLSEDFKFDIVPGQINRENYQTYAAQYLASVEDPPIEQITYTNSEVKNEEIKFAPIKFFSLDFDIDKAYRLTSLSVSEQYSSLHEDPSPPPNVVPRVEIETTENSLIGSSGKLVVIYHVYDVLSYYISITITATLKDEIYKAWQMKAWNSLRDAAETNFQASRQRLRDRVEQLKAEIEDVDDALTLRKIEREEVMKGVIRWLFGPTFRFVPQGLKTDKVGLTLYGSDEQVASDLVWHKMLAFGEFIKFMHNAIEWENMLYFLYPYFWTHPNEWDERKYMRHPDATHQQFLKSGSARIVLTIRPGFEKDFVSLIETGSFENLPSEHPYVSIAKEMQNYAEANYPGIASANPSKHGGAWRQIQKFSAALESLYWDCGRYPTTQEGLAALIHYPGDLPGWKGAYLSRIHKDPWGNEYAYKSPGDHGGFDIISYGADGRPGGEDENADVVSWAEGSLIGTWIEYTPTSALDIAIGEEMPNA